MEEVEADCKNTKMEIRKFSERWTKSSSKNAVKSSSKNAVKSSSKNAVNSSMDALKCSMKNGLEQELYERTFLNNFLIAENAKLTEKYAKLQECYKYIFLLNDKHRQAKHHVSRQLMVAKQKLKQAMEQFK